MKKTKTNQTNHQRKSSMKPKTWVDLSAIKRLLVMPSYLCWFSCEAAAAHPHSSCKCSPSLLSKVSLVSPSLSLPLCLSHQAPGALPAASTGMGRKVSLGCPFFGQDATCCWTWTCSPKAPGFGEWNNWHCSYTCQEVVAWGQGKEPQLEGLCSLFSLIPSHFLSQPLMMMMMMSASLHQVTFGGELNRWISPSPFPVFSVLS